ncbi:MAG: PilZ domain-containing protein [Gammaproteobacteria bacterium]|nr:PilZ domain-containing protein [Gammaproteobacteria bacterium]
MKEKRRYFRKGVSIEVVVRFPGGSPITLQTGDISEGGVFLLARGHQMPKVGTDFEMSLPELIGGDRPLTVSARVVRKTEEGIGVEFLLPIYLSDNW